MNKLYVIRREDWLEASAKGQLPAESIREFGSIWLLVSFSDEQKQNYKFSISPA